jgi:HlyD family secretion protein
VRLAATEINNVVTYTVIIEATNEDRRLFPGMTANVRIESARREGVLRIANDALRFRPRDQADGTEARSTSDAESRSERTVERLKGELELTPDQVVRLREEIAAITEEGRAGAPTSGLTSPTFDPTAFRQKILMRIEQSIAPTMSEEQHQVFERWKRGREGTRMVVLWSPGPDGKPQRRTARIGLADDQFTEILGGDIAEGDKMIVRVRGAGK